MITIDWIKESVPEFNDWFYWIKDWKHSEKKVLKFKCRCRKCYEEYLSILKLDGVIK